MFSENVTEEELTDEQKVQQREAENLRYIENLRFHIKARKRRQSHVSLKDKEDFNKDIDASTDVITLEALLHEMGGFILIKDAQTHEVSHNDAFLAEQTRRAMAGY